jgi:hypothetical protein
VVQGRQSGSPTGAVGLQCERIRVDSGVWPRA